MKKLLMAILLVAVSASSWADSSSDCRDGKKRHGSPAPEKMLNHMTDELSLSKDQASKIQSILEQTQAEMKKAREQQRELRKQTDTQINAVLTDEQQEKFAEMREKRKEKRKDKARDAS